MIFYISLREYISRRKIQLSASELYMTDGKIIDVAVKYGYSSQEAFTRAFVNVFGISPAAYRRLQKPTPSAEKTALLGQTEQNLPYGGYDMKLYVKQLYDWNCYAFCAESVPEQYWDFFRNSLYFQMGNNFFRVYDNVKDCKYCADNFTEYGETAVKQQLK